MKFWTSPDGRVWFAVVCENSAVCKNLNPKFSQSSLVISFQFIFTIKLSILLLKTVTA